MKNMVIWIQKNVNRRHCWLSDINCCVLIVACFTHYAYSLKYVWMDYSIQKNEAAEIQWTPHYLACADSGICWLPESAGCMRKTLTGLLHKIKTTQRIWVVMPNIFWTTWLYNPDDILLIVTAVKTSNPTRKTKYFCFSSCVRIFLDDLAYLWVKHFR
jgi:hypothetical protein